MALDWLDAARYADSHGYSLDRRRVMWPWRDWVIRALNDNMPFDRFALEQLAGDLLPDATLAQRVATGFNRNHSIQSEGGVINEEYRVETVVDRVETTTAVFLGLTFGCARCHDHKYDPISQREFYEFYALFNNVPETAHVGNADKLADKPFVKVPSAAQRETNGVAPRRDCRAGKKAGDGAATQGGAEGVGSAWPSGADVDGDGRTESGAEDVRAEPGAVRSAKRRRGQRGSAGRAWPMARRCAAQTDSAWPSGFVGAENPLTARVVVNRFWQMHFGTGIVKSSEDFGAQGEWPTHPALLDWLAAEFVRSGWNRKAMHKLIVMSATYQQVSRVSPGLLEVDPANRLFARGPRFRLPAEMIRDHALASSGLLGRPARRGERPAVSAAGAVGRCGLRERAAFCAGSRRETLPPQPVHVLEALRATAEHAGIRRAVARGVRADAGQDEHAARRAGADERPDVCRGVAQAGRAGVARRRRDGGVAVDAAASLGLRPATDGARAGFVEWRAGGVANELSRRAGGGTAADGGWRVAARPGARRGGVGRLRVAGQRRARHRRSHYPELKYDSRTRQRDDADPAAVSRPHERGHRLGGVGVAAQPETVRRLGRFSEFRAEG